MMLFRMVTHEILLFTSYCDVILNPTQYGIHRLYRTYTKLTKLDEVAEKTGGGGEDGSFASPAFREPPLIPGPC